MYIGLSWIADIAALIALCFAIYSYYQATRQLKIESENIRELNTVTLKALQNANIIEGVRFDSDGKVHLDVTVRL